MTDSPSIRAGVALIVLLTVAACGGKGDQQPPARPSSQPQASTPSATMGQPGRFNAAVKAIVYAPDGSGDVYVAGLFTTYNERSVRPVVRLKPDGSLNEIFLLTSLIGNAVTNVAVADDGSGDLYVGEVLGDVPTRSGRIWRVNGDGSRDATFARGEVKLLGIGEPSITQILVLTPVGDRSGRMYVGGQFNRYNGTPVSHGMVRVNVDGRLDRSFAFAGATSAVSRVLPTNDGDLYVISYERTDINRFGAERLYRVNFNGSLDSSFVTVNVHSHQLHQANIRTIAPLDDGSNDLYTGGTFIIDFSGRVNPLFDPTAIRNMARVNQDGTRDRNNSTPVVGEANVAEIAKTVDNSGDWIIVTASSAAPWLVRRFRGDGRPAPDFIIGKGVGQLSVGQGRLFTEGRAVLLPVPDGTGDIYVAGELSSYNGVNVGNLVRINANGALD